MCISNLAEAIVEPVGIPLRSNETNKRRALNLLVMPTKLPAASLLSAKRPRGSSINDASALATMRISIAEVGTSVGVGEGMLVGVGVSVSVGTGTGAGVAVAVGTGVGVGEGMLVGVTVGVDTRVGVGVSFAVDTGTGVAVGVAIGAGVAVAAVAASVGVAVARSANVAVGNSPPQAGAVKETPIRMASAVLTRMLGNMGCLFSHGSASGYYAHHS